MIDTTTWKRQRLDVVEDLILDPNNVRLETRSGVPEVDIIQDLFQNEKALEIVEGIAQIGYLTHEVPVVVFRGPIPVVVEGNRRVAALKVIQNPYLVPAFQSKVEALVSTIVDRSNLRVIDVLVAPSQEDANQLIAALHTGSRRVNWSRPRQAKFFQAQLDAGKTLFQLKLLYPTIDVREFVARSSVLALFASVDYGDPKLTSLYWER